MEQVRKLLFYKLSFIILVIVLNHTGFYVPINDKEYLKICAKIAKVMSISLSSAKESRNSNCKRGLKTLEEKRKVANDILRICGEDVSNKLSSSEILISLWKL